MASSGSNSGPPSPPSPPTVSGTLSPAQADHLGRAHRDGHGCGLVLAERDDADRWTVHPAGIAWHQLAPGVSERQRLVRRSN
jgi:hypothetical protein